MKQKMHCFLLLDDEQKLSAKDLEWSGLNIPITGGHTKGLGNHEEQKSARVGAEGSKKSKKGVYSHFQFIRP